MPGKLRRFSPARWKALAWFHDYVFDRNSVMGRPTPTRRMREKMLKEGQIVWVEGYLKRHPFLILTAKGQEILASKHKRLSERTRAQLLAKRLHRNTQRARTAGMDRAALEQGPSAQSPLQQPPEAPDEQQAPPPAR